MSNSTFLDRMREEHAQLAARVTALHKFIYSDGTPYADIPRVDQVELCKQLAHMQAYLTILSGRIWTALGTSTGKA